MARERRRLALAAILLFAAWAGCTAPRKPKEVMSLASATLADLTTGDAAQACSRIYEPSEWAPDRGAQDRRELAGTVAAVLNEAGAISGARIMHAWTMYEVQLTGADGPYWQARPNLGIDTRVTYAVDFSRIGPGVLSFAFTHLSGKWELRSISFGVETSAPNARETSTRMARVVLASMTPGMSGEQLDRTAEQMIGESRL